MAVTKTHPIKSTLKAAIDYILNPEKTDGKLLASSFGCGLETADIEFAWTREAAGDRGTHLGRHLIQSFAVGETTPEEAHKIGMELAKEILGGKYEFVLTTHVDKDHLHNHLIFNAVSFVDYKKYHSNKQSYYTKADDGTVKIESVDQDELKKQLETDSTAQIDVSGLEAEKVTLPVSAVNDVLDLEAKALSIKMADAAITLDKTAMQSVVETADGNDIQLHVRTGDALSSDQTEIIGDIEQGMALDVSLTANGTEIRSFNGKVTVSVPFTWTQQGVLQAWYLADDGTKEPVEVAYRDGNAVLTLKHFSTYAIVVKANDPDSGIVSMGENEVTVQKQADAVYYAAALYAEDGRFLAYAASEAAEDEETVTLKWANADWSKAAKVKVFP